MPELNGFKVWIEMEGATLAEYAIEEGNEDKTVECWVPSEVGKTFRLGYHLPRDSLLPADLAIRTFFDGKNVSNKSHLKGYGTQDFTSFISEIVTSPTTSRTFLFSSLNLTDDDRYLNPAAVQGLGEIKVVICQVYLQEGARYLADTVADLPGQNKKVHERSKKAIKQCINFGEKIEHVGLWVNRGTYGQPFATFTFKYRQMDLLRADGIAPSLLGPRGTTPPEDNKSSPGPSPGSNNKGKCKMNELERYLKGRPEEEMAKRIRYLEKKVLSLKARQARRPRGSGSPSKRDHDMIDLTNDDS